jgi:hypothetical protein
MRKLIIGAIAALALLAVPAVARAATPAPPVLSPVTEPAPPTLPGGTFCKFTVDIAVVANTEYQLVTTLPDGNTVTTVAGELILSFKNDTTGKAIQENVSGPTTTFASADGLSGTELGAGRSWWAFGPGGQKNTGEPGLIFTQGPVITTYAPNAAGVPTTQTFSLVGTQQNGCALLS